MKNSHLRHWHYGNRLKRSAKKKVKVTYVQEDMLRHAVGAAAMGNAMEWFDFGVYGYLTTTISRVFFPSDNHALSLIAALATFTVAFVVRPIGGVFFGRLGDRYGRNKILALTMIMMALSTLSIGLIPSQEHIGILAPILLLLARMVQGFSTGGEYGGAATFIAEYSTDKLRGRMGSMLEVGTMTGYVAGAGLVALLQETLSDANMLSWGWRIPFLIAGPIGLLGLYLRTRVEDTPAFKAFEESKGPTPQKPQKLRLSELLSTHGYQLIQCVLLSLLYLVPDYMLLVYMPSYMVAVLHKPDSVGMNLILVVMIVMIPLTLLGGLLSDYWGRKPIIAAGALGFICLSIPCLLMLGSDNNFIIFAGLMIMGVFLSCFTGTMPSTLPALFYTPIRYSALALGFNFTVSLFGGTTPLLTQWLVSTTHDIMVPAYYMMAVGVIGLVTLLFLSETAGRPLRGSPPAVAAPPAEAEKGA